jgi:hypothetical protein
MGEVDSCYILITWSKYIYIQLFTMDSYYLGLVGRYPNHVTSKDQIP